MKRTFTVIALTVLVWGCNKKVTPTASKGGPSSNSGSVVTTPSNNAPAAANTTPLGTTPATPEGSRTPAAGSATMSPEMMGQATYNAKCQKCHALKITTNYTADRWISVMQVMAPKAQLSDTEKDNVLAYVKANAKQ